MITNQDKTKTTKNEGAIIMNVKDEKVVMETGAKKIEVQDEAAEVKVTEVKATEAEIIRPGKVIRDKFAGLVAAEKVDAAMLEKMQDKDFTRKNMGGIKYAFLKKVDAALPLKDQAKIKGKARYSTKAIAFGTDTYLMCNDLYLKNMAGFVAFADAVMAGTFVEKVETKAEAEAVATV